MGRALERLAEEIAACRRCPRLVRWREQVAREKRRAYAAEAYWGRPVPGFGDPAARLLVVGLAPGAHGANRTGRMFTGDGSGDFLYAALHRAGLSSQPLSRSRDDGLRLAGCFITAACRCAPPQNRPAPAELEACAPFLDRELELLREVRAALCLGAVAWAAALRALSRRGAAVPRPRPAFQHGAELRLAGAPALVASYHVSRQNTQTGRLTAGMFDAVLARALALAARG
jgi:uracil-DNA glycosylase family 4